MATLHPFDDQFPPGRTTTTSHVLRVIALSSNTVHRLPSRYCISTALGSDNYCSYWQKRRPSSPDSKALLLLMITPWWYRPCRIDTSSPGFTTHAGVSTRRLFEMIEGTTCWYPSYRSLVLVMKKLEKSSLQCVDRRSDFASGTLLASHNKPFFHVCPMYIYMQCKYGTRCADECQH